MGQLERELGAANQRAVSIDVLRAQHDAIVDELKRNLETDNEVRRQTRQMTLDSSTKHEGDLTRNRELTGLKASLAGMMNQFNQLKTDYNKVKTMLLDKEKKLVEQEQLVGEYRLKLDQVKSRHFKDDQSVQRAKQELTSDMMGFADLSSQLVVLEQRAANAEARLTSKTQESDIRAQTIARLEERIREGRDERVKLERSHDQHMGALKKKLNEDHMRHAQELRITEREHNSSYRAQLSQVDLATMNRQLEVDLEKRNKNVKLLLERMKKQREVMHQMQKRITQLESNEKALNAEFVEMEKQYQARLDKLQQPTSTKTRQIK